MPKFSFALSLVAFFLISSTASAEIGPEHAPHNIVGAKWTSVSTLFEEHKASGMGLTLFYERVLLEETLEIEVSSAYLDLEEHTLVPIDLVLKAPFYYAHHTLEPYIGGGLAMDILLSEHHTHLYPGVLAVAGSYIWFTPHLGLDVEVVYGLVFEEHTVQELLPSVGIVASF